MKFSQAMLEFFDKLAKRSRSESEINTLKEIFTLKGILFEDLMGIGELSITEATL